jgi:hypothetical protein
MAKRPAPEDFVVSPPAKKARKYEPKWLYTVKVTHYTDDYKARGSDWASSEDVGAFRSRNRLNGRTLWGLELLGRFSSFCIAAAGNIVEFNEEEQ